MFTLRTKEELWNAFESGHYHSNLIKYAKHWHFKMVFSEVELMISVQNTQYCMIRQTGKNEWMRGMYFKTLFTGLFTLVGLIWNLLGFTVFLAQLDSGILCLHKKIYTFSKLTMELFTNNACFGRLVSRCAQMNWYQQQTCTNATFNRNVAKSHFLRKSFCKNLPKPLC